MVSKGQCLWPSSPRLGSTIRERHGSTGVSPAKDHKGWEHLAQNKRLGELGLFSFQEEKGQGEFYLCVSIFDRRLQRRQKQTLLSGVRSEGNEHKVS